MRKRSIPSLELFSPKEMVDETAAFIIDGTKRYWPCVFHMPPRTTDRYEIRQEIERLEVIASDPVERRRYL